MNQYGSLGLFDEVSEQATSYSILGYQANLHYEVYSHMEFTEILLRDLN